jgi:PAS domain S-box-containing protein/putative nucleotidyltransferase with HDIG domain
LPKSALFNWARSGIWPATRNDRRAGISATVAARFAAVLFFIGGAIDLATALQPTVRGLDVTSTVAIGLCAGLIGIVAWRLPWERWPQGATLWLAPAALLCIGFGNAVGGQEPWLWSLFFLLVFAWIGMCHPPGRTLWVLPIFALAYIVPLYPTHQASALAVTSVVYVGIVCVILGESVAWVSARWRHAESQLNTLMANLPGMAYRCADDQSWTMQLVSAGCEALTGHPPQALIANATVAYGDLVYPQDAEPLRREIEAAIDRDEPWTCTYRIVTAAGEVKRVWERGVAVKGDNGSVRVLEGFIQDVTEQREAEEKLTAAAREWRQTFDAMRDSVCVLDAEGFVQRCNRATTELAGVSYPDLVGRHCYEVFHGAADTIADCPLQRARRSGQAESTMLEQGGRWLWVSFQPTVDAQGNFTGGIHVVSDISELKRAEERLIESLSRLQAVSEEVIGAIAAIVEIRDPYTAGHQRRVSELAATIAAELGLDEDTIAGVRVAGMVHDVGKVTVPAEILTKPGRLSEIEFLLITAHAEAGYEILRTIQFPWPVAELARQHHERLDGSGYPRGLTGDDILLEARILAVADVVEAMASDRPYRAALGLEAALAEIESGSGQLFDTAAVDACVRVFAGGEFTLEERPRVLAPAGRG